MEQTRVQKYLAECGICSRRQAEQLIRSERVFINGQAAVFGDFVAEGDSVYVDGEPVRPAEKTYVLFHKPRGVVAEFEAPGKETLLSFLKELGPRVFAVDPLPEDAAGALFLTNDGALVNDLNQPGCHVERVYLASVEGRASEGVLERLAAGVRVDEESVTRVQAVVLDQRMRTALLRIRLRETGSVRVSRVLDAVGLPVYELRRVEYGGLHLGDLEPGQWRPLAKEEMQSLYREMRL